MIEHLQQPEGSKTCGHHCIAMIAGISVERVIELIGHDKGTNNHQLQKALKKLGFNSECRVYKNKKYISPLSILLFKWKKGGHWVVCEDGKIFDPGKPYIYMFDDKHHKDFGGTLTNHINVW